MTSIIFIIVNMYGRLAKLYIEIDVDKTADITITRSIQPMKDRIILV